LARIIITIFITVPAISNEAYTSFGSSNKRTILLAESWSFVFSILISFLSREKRATSAPDIVKVSTSKTARVNAKKTVACGFTASKIIDRESDRETNTG
jgi:hypothetical protein